MKSHTKSLMIAALAGVASSCLIWQAAAAQATAPATQAAANNETSSVLPEVIITSRKREESLQKVPISVDVVTGQSLVQNQVTDFYDLQKMTPSLVVTSYQGLQNNFAIRGVGTAVYGIQLEQSVGMVVDDVPIALPNLYSLEAFDMQRIEVLDGPQGMLFGKNASAGLMNIVTNDPVLNRYEVIGHAEYGHMDDTPGAGNRYHFDAAVNIPLGDTAALRLTGFWRHDDEIMANTNPAQSGAFLGQEQGGIRGKLLWEPNSKLKVLISGDYTHVDGPGSALLSYRYAPAGSTLAALNTAAGITPGPDNLDFASAGKSGNISDLYGLSLKASYDLGGGYTVTDVTAYRHFSSQVLADNDLLPESIGLDNLIQSEQPPATQQQVSEELRFNSPSSGRLTYQGGVFYQNYSSDAFAQGRTNLGFNIPGALENDLCVLDNLYGGSCPATLPPGYQSYSDSTSLTDLSSQSYAAFFEGQYKILDNLSWTLGGRYTNDQKSYHFQLVDLPDSFLCVGIFFPNGCNFYPSQNHYASVKAQNFSWRTSLDYTIQPNVMAYFTYGRGYKGPGFDTGEYGTASLPVALVKPEISQNYELGVKSTLLDHKLQLNAAVFYEIFTDFQTSAIVCQASAVPGGACTTTILNTNAGHLISRGVEAQFAYVPVAGLTINGGVTYLNAFYQDLYAGCYPNQPVGTGPGQCNNALWLEGVSNDSGNQLAQAPKWSLDLSARYDHPVANGWNGFIQGDVSYRTSFNFEPNDDPGTELSNFATVNGSLGVRTTDGRIGITVFARNLTDQRVPTFLYITGASVLLQGPSNSIGLLQSFSPDSFRQFGVQLDYRM